MLYNVLSCGYHITNRPKRKYLFRRLSPMNVLIINAGSSSLKYQLMDPETGAVSA